MDADIRTVADLLAALGVGTLLFDVDARLAIANGAFRDSNLGLSQFLQPGIPWDMFLREAERRAGYPPELCARLRQAEAALLHNDGPCEVIEATLAGQRRCEFVLGPVSDGGFVLIQSPLGHDRSEVDAAREAEALLKKVLEASPNCLTMSRIGDGQVIYRSPAATDLLGTARSSFAHFANRTERADFITALLPNGRVDDMRVIGLNADGHEFPAQLSARLIDYGGEDVIVSSMEDLTAKIEIEAELARNREQLFQAEKMSVLGELLASVAHELNNPLSIILGNAGILRDDLDGTPHTARIDKLSLAADRCVGIVRSFLSMAREQPLDLAPVAFRDIVETATEATAELTGPGIEVAARAPPDLPKLLADRVQLAQVLINLITNAIHAMEESGTGSRISVEAVSARGRVKLRVADDGPGIDETIRGRVFDPLFTTKAPGKGTGVGLAFCLRIVTAHDGTITLAPSSGRGAMFILDLPAAN